MFNYYAQWVPKYSDKIKLLVLTKNFPMSKQALEVFLRLKKRFAKRHWVLLNIVHEF